VPRRDTEKEPWRKGKGVEYVLQEGPFFKI
jgi:hypothetical protein